MAPWLDCVLELSLPTPYSRCRLSGHATWVQTLTLLCLEPSSALNILAREFRFTDTSLQLPTSIGDRHDGSEVTSSTCTIVVRTTLLLPEGNSGCP